MKTCLVVGLLNIIAMILMCVQSYKAAGLVIVMAALLAFVWAIAAAVDWSWLRVWFEDAGWWLQRQMDRVEGLLRRARG